MIAIIDYGMGNLGSIKNMIRKIGGDAIITSNKDQIKQAQKLILPGVGAFDAGISKLRELDLIDLLNHRVLEEKVPILGVCLGVQLMTKRSDEGKLQGLGWFDAQTVKFNFSKIEGKYPLPNIGWRNVQQRQATKLFDGIFECPKFYFVHTYHLLAKEEDIVMEAHYGFDYPVGLVKDNIMGVQFHPEKSHKFGMKLYDNFLKHF
jgi:glutamine amidotransferase